MHRFLGTAITLALVAVTLAVAGPSGAATGVLGIADRQPIVDPQTRQVIVAGVVGDTLDLTASVLSGAVTVQFAGAGPVNATVTGPGAYSVVVPAGATTGTVVASDTHSNSATSVVFQVWASRSEPYVMPDGHLNVTLDDLRFILDQVKIGEAHSGRTRATTAALQPSGNAPSAAIRYPYDVTSATRCLQPGDLVAAGTPTYGQTLLSDVYTWSNLNPWGVRQVDGQCNNITNVTAESVPASGYSQPLAPADTAGWGAGDQTFTRLTPSIFGTNPYTLSPAQRAYQNPTDSVSDPTTRMISNLIADQSTNNPAAEAASAYAFSTLYGTGPQTTNSVNATTGEVSSVYEIPNVTADYNVSAGYNSWFTLFGQFFDHGLDLIPKNGATVLIPLQQGDPLYVPSPGAPNFMILTRGAGADGESINNTTPYVDQSQTYGSHPAQNFFVREYTFAAGTGLPSADGRLLEGTDLAYTTLPPAWNANRTVGGTLTHATGDTERANGGLATWKDIKAQARLLGIGLTDYDARSIPVVATDQYGTFIPGTSGMPMVLFSNGSSYVWASGTAANPIGTGAKSSAKPAGGTSLPGQSGSNWVAVGTGHAFIDDTMVSAVPFDAQTRAPLAPDADTVVNSWDVRPVGYYDNEALDTHYVAGDGRVNENIGLSAVHTTFHSEHNTVVQDISDLLANDPMVTTAFRNEWNGERLYQAARFVTEMEYQHLAFDEFIRRIAPNLQVFLQYNPSVNPAISAEFASAVYRVGHSMLDETLARSDPGTYYDPANNQDVSLIDGFTDPPQARLLRPMTIASATKSGSTITYTLAAGETPPSDGAIVTVTGMDAAVFNQTSAVVGSHTPTAFSISTRYPGGDASGAVALPPTPNSASSASTVASTDGALLGKVQVNDPGPSGYPYSPGSSTAAFAQGMSSQRGNEIDEFVTDAVRNNLLGLPLDLGALNLTRGRDTGLPTLNQFRAQNAPTLQPYASWKYFVDALRYPESGVNFVAAYGTHPSLTAPVTIGAVTGATAVTTSGSNLAVTYTVTSASGIHVGDVVTVSGLTKYNETNAVVSAVVSNTFTVTTTSPHAPSAIVSYPSTAALMADGPVAITGSPGTGTPTGATGSVTREPNIAERRPAATALVSASGGDGFAFMTSSGAWQGVETGINDVDLWIGGLAENPAKQPLTPPMFGPTFQLVFQNQMLALQDSDRLYYLGRLAGRNLGDEIPAQKLTDIVRRNTPSAGPARSAASGTGILGMVSPGFGIADCAFSRDAALVPTDVACAPSTLWVDPLSDTLIHNGLDNVTGFADPNSPAGIHLAGGAGDDSIFGTRGPDRLDGGASGGDLIDGYGADDVLIGGPGEDLLKGGANNDTIDSGESQAGDTVDGNSGSDFQHCGKCQGGIVSSIGEAGDDYIQGGVGADLLLQGAEGNDWIEGLDGADVVNGDNGAIPGAGVMVSGGSDVLIGGGGFDIVSADGGDDVVGAGDAVPDLIVGGQGFDWVTYESIVRFENGPTVKPAVWTDLSGVNPNPRNSPTDALLGVEGVSGGPGNDVLFGGLATDVTVPFAVGKRGSTTLVIHGTYTQIVSGMIATGNGISPNATTIGPGAVAVVNGVTTTTVDLNAPLTADLAGPVTFASEQLRNPGLITGLTPLLRNTPGWKRYTATDPNATTWSGGTILFGGPGDDTFTVTGGEGIVHGGAMLHVCLVATSGGVRFTTNADTTCDGGPGYSSMTALAPFMDAGTLRPGDLRTVRELVFLSPSDVAASQDVLALPGPATDYVFQAISPLPAGVTAGFSVTGPDGLVTTVYDVALVKFGAAAPVPMVATQSTLSALSVVTGTTSVALSPKFSSPMRIYSVTVPNLGTSTSVNLRPTVTTPGSTVTVNGLVVAPGKYSNPVSLSWTLPTVVPVVVTAPNGQKTTYTVTVDHAGTAPKFSTPVTNRFGFALNLTNYAATNTYSYLASAGNLTVGLPAGTNLPLTVTGLVPGQSSVIQVIVTRPGYSTTSGVVTGTASTTAALTPTFDTPVRTPDGFTVNVTDYDPTFTFTPTSTAGAVNVGAANGAKLPLTVTGLTPNQAAKVTLTTTSPGVVTGSASVTANAALGAAKTVSFSTPVQNPTGFTVNITDYSSAFAYAVTTSLGTVTKGTAAGSTLPLRVNGLSPGQTATITVATTRTNYTNGSATVASSAVGSARIPTTSQPVSTGTGFTFNITNYSATFTWNATVTAGSVVLGAANGSTRPVTVSGLSPSQSASVHITATNPSYLPGATDVTGTAPLAAWTPILGPVTRTSTTSFTVHVTNWDAAYTWAYSATSGTVSVGPRSGSDVLVTVWGLNKNQQSTLTVATTRTGYTRGSTSVTG